MGTNDDLIDDLVAALKEARGALAECGIAMGDPLAVKIDAAIDKAEGREG